jgi:5-methylcytosine-specific restriction endonuclease McrA
MTRSVSEWIGKTPDTPIPARVKLRVYDKAKGRCQNCTRKIPAGDPWDCDHIKALINGGKNREGNLQCLCSWCHLAKTRVDVAEKSDTARKRKTHLGIKKPKQKMAYRRFDGTPVWPERN